MYRIRSASGNEVSYSSLEEFSAAVRRGEVHPEDEIFHTRANRWLDVKSHPHYRSATAWQGHEPAAATAPRAPAPAPSTAPMRPAPGPSNTSRAQVFERPVVRAPQQTTVRPQLQPSAPQAEVAVHPEAPAPRKSKELEFIDVGDVPGTKPEVKVTPQPKLAPKPVAKTEVRPAAATIAPPAPAPAPPAPAPTPAPAPVAQAPAPVAQVPAAPPAPPAPPAPKGESAVTGPGSEVDFLVMDTGMESPVRTSAGHKTIPEDLDLLFDAPLPQAPAPTQTPPSRDSGAAKAPSGPPSGKSAAVNLPAPASAHRVDLDIPSGPLLEAPAPTAVAHPVQHPGTGQSKGVILGGGLALIAVAATLLAWRPWSGGTSVADASTSEPVAQPAPPPMVAAPAPTPIRTTTTTAAATTPSGKPGATGKPTDSAATPDSPDSAGDDQIIAVAKPSFRPDVGISAPTDISIGTDVGGRKSNVTPSELVRRMVAAERQAQQELNNRLASVGFRNLLAAERLNSTSGVGSARSAWNAGADALRQYRGRIARLESAYEDSVLTVQRSQRWSGGEMSAWATRQSLAESGETTQLADLMFSQVNEGLEILAALSGEYTVKGEAIAFKNAASATRYTSIRGWVESRTSTWTGIPESARPYSVTAILHALGEGFPAAQ